MTARIISLCQSKGALAWYGKLTWETAHAWILKILLNLYLFDMCFVKCLVMPRRGKNIDNHEESIGMREPVILMKCMKISKT